MKGNSLKKAGLTAGIFALGAAAGSVLALLYAPASGKVTRKRIASGFRSAGRSTVRQLNQTRKVLAKKAGALRNAATEKIGDTREWLLERVSNGNGKHHAMTRRSH